MALRLLWASDMTSRQRALALSLVAIGCGGGDTGSSGGGGNVGFGGAQDIGAFRAILDEGGIPGEATLDAGGFFAEHYSESPPADCGQPLCVVSRMAVGRDWVSGGDQAFVQLSMTTPVDPSTVERKPLNLVVVIDTSGSMAEDDRIGYVRQGLHRLIDELEDGDRLALVTYESEVTQWSNLVLPLDREELHAVADRLEAAGGTNLYGGLEMGFQIASSAFDLERQNRVMLMSDGLPTAGITDDASIIGMAERNVSDGVGLTTIGVGLDFNIDLMRQLAERGAGSFYFLESPQAIAEVFSEELDYAIEPIALDVALDVQAEPTWQIGEVLGTHAWAGSPGGGGVQLPAVFVASRTDDQPGEYGRRGGGGALFLSVAPTSGNPWLASGPVATIDLSYRLPGSSEVLHQEVAISSEASADSDDPWLSAESMAEHYAMVSMYLGLREATREAAWSYSCARTALARLDERAARWVQETGDEDIEADRTLIAQFIGNLEARGGVAIDGDDTSVCAGGDGYDPVGDDVEQYPDGYYACSAAGGRSGWWLAVMALLLVYRRRR
jgi:Ca-activated chloride channel family protein